MESRSTQERSVPTAELLSLILDHSRECTMLLGPDNTFAFVNKAACDHLSISDEERFTYAAWLDFWPRSSQDQIKEAIDQARSGCNAQVEVSHFQSDGSLCWVAIDCNPVQGEPGSSSSVLLIAREVTGSVNRRLDAERKAAQSDDVSREMRHRFKNQLAVISSLLRLSARNAASIMELTDRFEQRLAALARAQDFIALQRSEQLNASDAVAQILEASGAGDRIQVEQMPNACLGDEGVQALALILGELQTNALKHGALTWPDGQIRLSGKVEGGKLELLWREVCGTPILAPQKQGGGLKLLERMGSIPGGKARIEWQPEGIAATFYVRLAR